MNREEIRQWNAEVRRDIEQSNARAAVWNAELHRDTRAFAAHMIHRVRWWKEFARI
jgi:hypothetical protein